MVMLGKLRRSLTDDIAPLLPAGVVYDHLESVKAFNMVWTDLISRISGVGWKNSEQVIADLRAGRYPDLLQ